MATRAKWHRSIILSRHIDVRIIPNGDSAHEHGKCNPVAAFANEQVDAVVVQGIGAGAVNELAQLGIRVYKTPTGTVLEVVQALQTGKLLSVGLTEFCNHNHGDDHDCHHS